MRLVLFIILLSFVALPLLYWSIVLARVLRVAINRPTVRAGIAAARQVKRWPRLSIIVPAHNEEHEIAQCARTLLAQVHPDLEIIFVLDRCTDRTAAQLRVAVADDRRVVVIENDHCPEGWAGKCHAAQIGAERATGEWLLFTDADTRFDPQLATASMALALQESLALFSLLSTLRVQHRFEVMLQPVASMELMKIFPIARVNDKRTGRSFANGQFMLFERAWYDRIGGHDAVKGDLLEDIALARAIENAGGRGGVALADGMLTCAMYDSREAFEEGWRRIFIEACHRKPQRLRKYARRITILQVLMLLSVTSGVLGTVLLDAWSWPTHALLLLAVMLLGIACHFAAIMLIYRMAGAPVLAAFTYPIGAMVVGRIMRSAADDLVARKPVRWGGREYILEPR